MNGIIYVRVTQYQKHLIKDLLEENNISVIFDDTLDPNIVHIQYSSKHNNEIEQFVRVKDLNDTEFNCTMKVFMDIQKMINGNIEDFCGAVTDKIYLSMVDTNIILHRNNDILITMPYSHTAIYKKDES